MKLYNEQEKSILNNFFIKEGQNSKIEFRDYLESFIKKHGIKVSDEYKDKLHGRLFNELNNYKYSSFDYLWDVESGDNIITYIFSNKKFDLSSSKIKSLKKLNPNWNHLNNNNESFLFYIKIKRINEIKQLINEFKIDTDILNKNGEVFFYNIFNNYNCNAKDMIDLRLEETRLIDVMNLVGEYEYLIGYMASEKINKFEKSFNDCVNILEKKLYEIVLKEGSNNISYEDDKINDNLPFKDHRLFINKIINYHLLNKKLTNDKTNKKTTIKI